MTWKDLILYLSRQSEEVLEQDATVFLGNSEEAIAVEFFETVDEDHELSGVLDDGHLVLKIDF